MFEKIKLKRSRRAYWKGKGRRTLMIPNAALGKLIARGTIFNTIYVTDIGYYPKAISHYVKREKGSPENIIFYCSAGSGWYETSYGYFPVSSNQFFILPNNQTHRYGADELDPWTIYWIMFSGKISEEIINIKSIEHCFKPHTLLHPEVFFNLYDDMFNTLSEGYALTNLLSANMNLWLILMQFMHQNISGHKKLEVKPIKGIIDFMKKNLSIKLTVNDMAGRVCFSASHFNKLFKLQTGYSPLDYFIHLRMQGACDYLNNTDLRIKEIASLVGYDDPYLFSRIFTKTIGKCPRNYRTTVKI
ncbi:MAG: AraC family transcriptional regulator [Ginsengibacter sp.]